MASFYKRGPGQWEARVERLGWPSQCRTWRTKGQAIRWARKVEAQMDVSTFFETKEIRRMPLSHLIERYKTEITPRFADAREKCRLLDEIAGALGKYGVLVLDAKTIAQWRDRLARSGLKGKRSGSTVNHFLNALSAVYTAGRKEFHLPIPFNPVKLVTRLKENPARTQRVKDEVIDWLVAANKASNETRRKLGGREPFGEFEAWLRLAMEGAMRRSEIGNLEIQHIDLNLRTAHLPKTKNGHPRTVPLSSRASEIICGLLNRDPTRREGRLFTLTVEGFKTAFRRAKYAVVKQHPEVAQVRFHDTRREATTRLAKKLPNVVELAAVTGHRKLDMLKRYYQPDPVELAKKLD